LSNSKQNNSITLKKNENIKNIICINTDELENFELKTENIPYCEQDHISKREISLRNIDIQKNELKKSKNKINLK
jgi:hypothetical protein